MAIARIENGDVVEMRNIALDAVPAHKRSSWLPIEGDVPDYRPELEGATGPIYVVEAKRVLRTWKIARRPISDQRLAVKAEARRRILERFPDWKQTNMTARGVELQDIWRRNGGWTAQEQGEADALAQAWEWIKAVREASNALEALDEVPADYATDRYWPK